MTLGDNLSNYGYLETLSAQKAEGLRDMLNQIKLPFKIVSIWSDGKRHYCLISTTRKLKIIKGE